MIVDKKDRLLFMGDSITDSNRNYQAIPAGWSSWGGRLCSSDQRLYHSITPTNGINDR